MSRARILVVDDSPTQVAALRDLLEEAGYETDGARDAETALATLGERRWDLVLSDVVMPGMSGYELCRAIKTRVASPPPVVLLTSLSDPVDIVRGLEGGADNYITKPYDPDALLARIAHVLENRRLRGETPQQTPGDPVTVSFLGRTFEISAGREQILDLLLSSFEELVRTHDALKESQAALDEAHRRELAAEQAARRQAEATAGRMEILARASALFASATDVEDALTRLVKVVVPDIADACLIYVHDEDGGIRRVAGPEETVSDADVEALLADAGEVAVIDALPDPLARAVGRDAVTRPHECGALVVPMMARGRRVGVAVLARCPGVWSTDEEDAAVAIEVVGRAAMAADVLQLLQQETEARAAAEDATRLRDDVLATVSHDLRNPVGVVVSGAALLLDVDLPEEEQRRQLGVIRRSGERATRLIDDLLDVSTMESGRFAVAAEPTSPTLLLEEAREMMQPLAEEMGIALEIPDAGGLPSVRADRARVLQVFSNLVGNALKFSNEGGRVAVRAEAVADAVRFSVIDDGPGIAADDLPHIFDRFWQAGDRKGTGGAGLGLAIVKGIVEAHDGQVEARSGEGGGATFAFTLPTAGEDGAGVSRSA